MVRQLASAVRLLCLGIAVVSTSLPARADEAPPPLVSPGNASVSTQLEEMRRMIERQNQMIDHQNRVIEQLKRVVEEKEAQLPPGATPASNTSAGPSIEEEIDVRIAKAIRSIEEKEKEKKKTGMPYDAGYDKGFVIKPHDQEKTPFEMRVNGRMQFRHTGFDRDVRTWTDNAGDVNPVTNRNDFEIERGRLEFRGYFLDPKLEYFINLDSDTDDEHVVIFHDFWMNYEFHEALNVYIGKAFVPGSRDWLNGATRTRLVDRSMATTFFRPDRTIGIWAEGEPCEKVWYRAMIGNGFATTDLRPDQIDTNFVYSFSTWTDLMGDYGQGYSDLECHEELAVRAGHSFTYTSHDRNQGGGPTAEENVFRLSDGTRITDIGALAPGVTVDEFDVYLYTIDLATKYAGFSFNTEYFFRWLQSIRGNGALPHDDLFDHGFYAECGFFLIAKKLELNARYSQVYGMFGDSAETAAGFNWFINGTHGLKFTFDVTSIDGSPANNSGANYRVGDDGTMFRSQLQLAF